MNKAETYGMLTTCGSFGPKNLVALKIDFSYTTPLLVVLKTSKDFSLPTFYYSSVVSLIKVPGIPNYTSFVTVA